MSMLGGLLASAAAVAGMLMLWRGFVPARPALAVAVDRVLSPGPSTGQRHRILQLVIRYQAVDRALAVVGRSPEQHAVRTIACTAGGLAAGPILWMVTSAAGSRAPLVLPGAVTLVFAVVGAAAPTAVLLDEARERRAQFRRAFSAYLDLVAIGLAAGKGIESALESAARTGSGWTFVAIEQALYRAKRAGGTAWDGLDALTDAIGISEPAELAAAARLSGDSGSRLRASLAARARSMRERALAEAIERSESATERMGFPQALLTAGFLVLVGYPALARILGT